MILKYEFFFFFGCKRLKLLPLPCYIIFLVPFLKIHFPNPDILPNTFLPYSLYFEKSYTRIAYYS